MTARSRVVTVDLPGIRRNAQRYRDGGHPLIARLDHDACGLGLERVGAALRGHADWLAVDDLRSAGALRSAGVTEPILALSSAGADAAPAGVHIAVSSIADARAAAHAGAAGVHIVVDCGGAWRGAGASEAALLAEHTPIAVSGLMGVYGPETSPEQAAAVFGGIEPWIQLRHVHGTRGASQAGPGETVRVGRGLFGIPGDPGDAEQGGESVLRLTGTIVLVKRILAGEGVSYGYIHRAERDSRIALVTGGYADGVCRALGSAAWALVAGQARPIVGRIAMDVLVVDVGSAPASPGDEVVLLGDPDRGEPGLAEWAGASGLSAVELVAGIGPRVIREYQE